MKNLFAVLASVLAVVVSLASAQGLNSVPQCARGCVSTALGASGCGINVGCICGNKSLISTLSCCVKTNCDLADQMAALKFAQGICKLAKITTLPTSASCASTTAAAMGSASTMSATAATTMTGQSAAMSTMTGSAATMTGSAMMTGSATMMTGTATAAAMSSSTGAAHAFGVGGGVLAGAVGVAALVL